MKKTKLIIGIVVLAAVLGSATGCQKNDPDTSDASEMFETSETSETSDDTKPAAPDEEVTEDKAAVTTQETDHKYMEKVNTDVVDDFSWDNADKWFYSSKAEDFEDETLKSLASDYLSKGYYITDEKIINEVTAEGYGLGDYVFVTGFQAVDSKNGNESHRAEVLKMTPEEYALFIEDYFGESDEYEEKKDGSITVIKYDCYTLTYDNESEILIYESDMTGSSVG